MLQEGFLLPEEDYLLEALEEILSYYSHQEKQIFIALDKEESYSQQSQKYLKMQKY